MPSEILMVHPDETLASARGADILLSHRGEDHVSHRFVVVALFASLGLVTAPSAFADAKKSGVLRLASEGQYPPFNFFEKNKLTGFEIELAEAVTKELKLKPEWKTYPFDSLLIGLKEDRYDLVAASHSVTPERAKAVDFTDPEYCTGGMILAKAGGPKKPSDLVGKVVAVQVGTTFVTQLQAIQGIKEVKTYPKDTDCLQNLMAGRADAWVTEKFVGIDVMKKQPGLKLQAGETLAEEKIAMAVAKGNTDLAASVNKALAKLKKDGTYVRISKKYFDRDISCK
jgi:polar amino acid transport system substrate-binding protein